MGMFIALFVAATILTILGRTFGSAGVVSVFDEIETKWVDFRDDAKDAYRDTGVPFMKRVAHGVIAIIVTGVVGACFLACCTQQGWTAGIWSFSTGALACGAIRFTATRDRTKFSPMNLMNACVIGLFGVGLVIASTGAWVGDQSTGLTVEGRMVLQAICIVGTVLVLAGFMLGLILASLAGWILREAGQAIEGVLDWSFLALALLIKDKSEEIAAVRARAAKAADVLPDQYIFPLISSITKATVLYVFPLLAFYIATVSFKFTFAVMVVAVVAIGLIWASLRAAGIETESRTKSSVLLAETVTVALVVVTILEFLFGAPFAAKVTEFWQSVGTTAIGIVSFAHTAITNYGTYVVGMLLCTGLAILVAKLGKKHHIESVTTPVMYVLGFVGFAAFGATVWGMVEAPALRAANKANWLPKELMSLKPTVQDVPGSHVLVTWKSNDYAGTYAKYRIERRRGDESSFTALDPEIKEGVTTFKDGKSVGDESTLPSGDYFYRLVGGTKQDTWVPGREVEVFHVAKVPLPAPRSTATPPASKPPASGTPVSHPGVCNGPDCGRIRTRLASLCAATGANCK